MVASDVIATLDKLASSIVRKLKSGQELRIYDEDSHKEYGQKGSDIRCFFGEAYDTKIRGTTLKVYDTKNTWSIGLDCLLEVFDAFDPESDEGKKRHNKSGKRRGRKKAESSSDTSEFDTQWTAAADPAFEPEEPGEEYDFTNSANWGTFYENE
jgi:hypothetical protein